MAQYDFDQLLQKYLAGACDPAEERLILDWYQDLMRQPSAPVDAREQAVIRERVWQKLAASTVQKEHPRALRPRPMAPYWLRAAACLLLLGVLGWWSFRVTAPTETTPGAGPLPGGIEQSNTSSKPQPIRLEDGTVVTLKPGSALHYPRHFETHSRTVFLTGEAFFTVKKDQNRPFIVHTGALVTEVLGTSFTIKSYEGAKAIEVSVLTGRVSVYQADDGAFRRSREVILKPNERITYSPHSKQLIPALVEHPVQVAPPGQPERLLFDGVTLPAVLTRLQTIYGIDIYLESDGLTDCVLNADLNDLALHEQLDLICRSVNAQYEVRGTSIFIKGPGCQP